MKLIYKIQIKGKLTVETGMHIGGSEVELNIGGIDNAVVKDSKTGIPYIPGSSLKGKLRDLIARKKGYKNLKADVEETFILFGEGANDNHRNTGHLIIRDAFFNGLDFDPEKGLEEKSENTIDRVTGRANPRNMERVVRGAVFNLDMVLDLYNEYNVKRELSTDVFKIKDKQTISDTELLNALKLGFRLLENDYLGGSGTRGYGKVSLEFEKPIKIEFNKDGTTKRSDLDFNFNE